MIRINREEFLLSTGTVITRAELEELKHALEDETRIGTPDGTFPSGFPSNQDVPDHKKRRDCRTTWYMRYGVPIKTAYLLARLGINPNNLSTLSRDDLLKLDQIGVKRVDDIVKWQRKFLNSVPQRE
jgi:hypothetical protein